MTKIKIIKECAAEALEEAVNNYISSSDGIRVVDIKFCVREALDYSRFQMVFHYSAMIIYEEQSRKCVRAYYSGV